MIKIRINGKEYTTEPPVDLGAFLQDVLPSGTFDFPCGGHGKCGKCKVIVRGEGLSELTAAEKRLLSGDEISTGVRLACETRVFGDAEIDLPGGSGERVVQVTGALPSFRLNPCFSRYAVAVDIGTTTIAAALWDMDGNSLASGGASNPQSRFGADVISRMEAALSGNASDLSNTVRNTVNSLISRLCALAGIETLALDGCAVTGNTAMLYLFAGLDVEPLTHAPFVASDLLGRSVPARDLGLSCLRADLPVFLPPCAAAFIGADIMCSVIAVSPSPDEGDVMIADIGTNGEIVLRSGGQWFACATAAGPAFEGAGISQGMGGGTGAIDKVWVNVGADGSPGLADVGSGQASAGDASFSAGLPLAVHVIGQEEGQGAKGICGSGLIDAAACLRTLELVDETGYMEGESVEIIDGVSITQKDVRALQLAKSAISAGMLSLLKAAGESGGSNASPCVNKIYIAGGFGSFLNIENAGKVGLIPEDLAQKAISVGNAALSGASLTLLSSDCRETLSSLASDVSVIELSTDPYFARQFMDNMMFP